MAGWGLGNNTTWARGHRLDGIQKQFFSERILPLHGNLAKYEKRKRKQRGKINKLTNKQANNASK